MFKHILFGLVFCLTCVSVIVWWAQPARPPQTLLRRQEAFTRIRPQDDNALPPVVREINTRNEAVRGLACEHMDVRVWEGGRRLRLTGKLYSEKPRHFRMEIHSVVGLEVDIGSNDQEFWYWSRRDPHPGVHYAKHEDYQKTRLKTPFDPVLLRNTLGIERLPPDCASVKETDDEVQLTYERTNAQGEPVLFSALVHKQRKEVEGYIISGRDGKILASCEIQASSGQIPTRILYSWYAEGKVVLFELNRTRLNPSFPRDCWVMPNRGPQTNMAEE